MNLTPARIEQACRAVWSPAERATIAGWSVVRNGGFTRRLNSASADGPATIDGTTHAAITSWITEGGGVSAPIRVTPSSHHPTMDAAAAAWDLAPVDPTLVVTRALHDSLPCDDAVVLTPPDRPEFIDDVVALNGYGDASREPWQGVVARIDIGTGLWLPEAAVALAGIVDGICCVFSVAVAPSLRGKGLASAVVQRAGAWGREHDAEHMALQVLGTNAPARRLYDRLGFETAYSYHYLEPVRMTSDSPS